MQNELPEFYFRMRDNGASVFRLSTDEPSGTLVMQNIASVALRSGEIRAQGGAELSASDIDAINRWLDTRRQDLEARDRERIGRLIEELNATAHWIQSKADQKHLKDESDALLLALHDLRSVVTHRKSRERDNED